MEEAIVDAIDTSGRAVLSAGITVCIALLGQFALGVSFLYGVATVVVCSTVLAALTLLLALPRPDGHARAGPARAPQALRRRPHGHPAIAGGRFCSRWTGALQARPIPIALVALVVMAALAVPFLSMRLGSSDASSDPAGTTTRQAYELLGPGFLALATTGRCS